MDQIKFHEMADKIIVLRQQYDRLGYDAKKFRDQEETVRKQLDEATRNFQDFITKEAGFKF